MCLILDGCSDNDDENAKSGKENCPPGIKGSCINYVIAGGTGKLASPQSKANLLDI